MTGGKGKRKAGGGGGPIVDAVPCEKLKFDAQLASPQPAVVATLRVGEVLAVDLVSMKGRFVVQVIKNGQPAGGLSVGDTTALRECIKQGHKFKATVVSINGGQVQVHIGHV